MSRVTSGRLRVAMSIAAVVVAAIAVPVLAAASSSRVSDSQKLSLDHLACPSASQCTAIDEAGREITFDPKSAKHVSRRFVLKSVSGLACPSTALCVVVSSLNPGQAVAFKPNSGRVVKAFTLPNLNAGSIDGNDPLACVSVDQCTAVTAEGELTFDPTTGATISNASLPGSQEGYDDVACTSATACTALFRDSVGRQGREVTFNPRSGALKNGGVVLLDAFAVETLACPSARQCTAGDHYGNEVTFHPNTGKSTGAGKVALWSTRAIEAVSCPSLRQCTARNAFGQVMTFDPRTGRRGKSHRLGPGEWIAIDCPSVIQCTVTGGHGDEVTFNPAQRMGSVHMIDH